MTEENNSSKVPEMEVKEYAPGEILTGKVTGITSFGAFVRLPDGKEGLVHISEIANTYVANIENFLKLDQEVKVKVLGKNQKGKYDLSIKQVPKEQGGLVFSSQNLTSQVSSSGKKEKNFEPGSFEEMIHNFMKISEEIQLDVRRNLQYRQGVKKKGKKKSRED